MKKQTNFLLSLLITEALIGSIFFVQYAGVQKTQVTTSQASGEDAVFLAFESTGKNHKKETSVGEEFILPVFLNTQGEKAFGADAVINFDPGLLEVVDIDPKEAGVQITPGSIFPRYFSYKADNNKGEIKLSGAAFTGSESARTFSGAGILGNITFRAKKEGTARIFFDFEKAATNESNVVSSEDTNKDLLEKTGNAVVKIVE